jgi:hypothetical protein
MDKRLAKRHKRQVSRERERVKLSEPDLRTPEEIKAARDASRATRGGGSMDAGAKNSMPAFRNTHVGTGSAAKTDG